MGQSCLVSEEEAHFWNLSLGGVEEYSFVINMIRWHIFVICMLPPFMITKAPARDRNSKFTSKIF